MKKSFYKVLNYLFLIIIILLIIFPDQKLNDKQTHYIVVVLSISFFIYLVISMYMDIKNRNSFIEIFIIGIDIVNIILFITWCYLSFKNINSNNTDIIWNRKINVHRIEYIIMALLPIKFILESKIKKIVE